MTSTTEQELLDWKADIRLQFDNARFTGERGKKRGLFKEFGRMFLQSANALMPLPESQFRKSRAEVQQGFDRFFKGTNIGTPQYNPGVRPKSNIVVMTDTIGYFLLLDFDHPDAWDEWEEYCTERHGVSAYRTEYGTENTLAGITAEADSVTRDLTLDAE